MQPAITMTVSMPKTADGNFALPSRFPATWACSGERFRLCDPAPLPCTNPAVCVDVFMVSIMTLIFRKKACGVIAYFDCSALLLVCHLVLSPQFGLPLIGLIHHCQPYLALSWTMGICYVSVDSCCIRFRHKSAFWWLDFNVLKLYIVIHHCLFHLRHQAGNHHHLPH